MNVFVVDASVAAKWLFDEDLSEAARRILHRGNRLYAPDFFLLEMDSVLCKRMRRGEITADDADGARTLLCQLPVEYYPFQPLQNEAFEIAKKTRHSVYDCLYAALAVLLEARMVTADRRFRSALAGGPLAEYVTWVEDVE